ncbi:long-chain fatty acid--CoA ligase [Salinisphaera orenii MK-B5]|uniref:Long-chain-fatty-acid--CoA ligase n=1 Tax=Salinisphaera orenii MK-B5 TaxID=856730 RepID=A0A423PQ45_9GAMM|nr:AMP-binding protein [Salinisphaera orenii]ROO27746.1 long-chain fatty acid--CoA ligase [Salinisphaera orenii MK-B5]
MNKNWLEHYPPGIGHTIDTDDDATLVGIIDAACRDYADRDAYSSMGNTIRFADVDRLSAAFAGYLQQVRGLQPGERFAIMMPNCLQYVVALFGALRAGLTVVNVNPLYTARELEHQLTDADVRTLLVMENFAATLEKIYDSVPVETVITTQLGDMLGPVRRVVTNFVVKKIKKMVPAWNLPGAVAFPDALAEGRGQTFRPVAVRGEDLAFLQYTGGTTGPAKGAMLTHANVAANVRQCQAWFAPQMSETGETIITALPMYHIFALTVNTLVYFSIGGHGVLITNPRDMPGFVKTLARHPFSAITGVNTLYNGLLNTEGFDKLDFSHLKFSMAGGMATQQAVAERWYRVTGRPIIEGYGLSETAPVVTCNPLDVERFNHSIGMPLPSTDVDIRDDDGHSRPPGEAGELCVRGPQVMRGYWRREDADTEAFTTDGFFRTGDIARQDEAGLFYIVDRKKDMILVSGFNVYPNEIEDVIVAHEGVLEAAAVGVPDEKSGEAVKLFVVRRRPDLSLEEVRRHCREHLTGYKVPKHYEFIDEVPKSNVGKILRKELR